jgi:serine/threonine-protein kinase RsbW
MGDARDAVTLVVPAGPEYLRLARMTAAGLASRLGFTYDDVEDLRIAVDELCFVLVGTAGRTGTIALTYRVEGSTLAIDGVGEFGDDETVEAPSELSEQILAAVVDGFELELTGDRPRFRLVKKASGPV